MTLTRKGTHKQRDGWYSTKHKNWKPAQGSNFLEEEKQQMVALLHLQIVNLSTYYTRPSNHPLLHSYGILQL